MNTNENPRNIVISQTQVMAMRQSGINRTQMAAHYGITPQEMHQVMTSFGIYKAKAEDAPEYNIILNHDFVNPLVNSSTALDNTSFCRLSHVA
jgi:2-polyprenyl-6-methoxyphenol hydroxylase-like FAD-dependent oxidoreductase